MSASAQEAAEFLGSRHGFRPLVGLVLGSGLGAYSRTFGGRVAVPYADIPGFAAPHVAGHAGELVAGTVRGVSVACLSGRVHLYEGHPVAQVVFGVRVLAELGCRAVLLTNAAGGTMYLGLRCAAACPSEGEIRARVKAASASVLVYKVQTMAASYYSQFEGPRTAASVAFGFSVVALVAAAAGLFSILTYAVNRRRREFGIRSAMGASPQQLRRLILRDGLLTAGAGLALGAAMAAAAAKTVNALVYGVAITNPPLWLGVAAVIVAVTLGSAWRPARDAAKTNPIELLRES